MNQADPRGAPRRFVSRQANLAFLILYDSKVRLVCLSPIRSSSCAVSGFQGSRISPIRAFLRVRRGDVSYSPSAIPVKNFFQNSFGALRRAMGPLGARRYYTTPGCPGASALRDIFQKKKAPDGARRKKSPPRARRPILPRADPQYFRRWGA